MSFSYDKVKDPRFFAENRLPAHSDHRFYRSREEMASEQSSFEQSLAGVWKFHWAKNYQSSVQGFETQDYDCRTWDDIRVPAHIQMEGFGPPQYVNIQYPWDGYEQIDPGQIPSIFNPVASYVKYFTLLPDMASDGNLFISFKGVESTFAVWLNGQYVGYAADGFTSSDFELTPYLVQGENKLAVQVFQYSAFSWMEDQDFYRFSGIFRDVVLYTVPKVHISDIAVVTQLDDDFGAALLRVTLRSGGSGKASLRLTYGSEDIASAGGEISGETVFEMPVKAPNLWSAEMPNLYELTIEVEGGGGLQEIIPLKVGFRRFELKGGIMCINGKRIEFRGVNRHEFGCLTGRVMSRENTERDLIQMKQHNINAVRTCHYPNNSFLYELCDVLGLYVIDEANIEGHGMMDKALYTGDVSFAMPGDRPEWLDATLDRANSMYQRDKNHPCILIWSCGNESFGGKNMYEMSQLLRKLDPGRLVHYESIAADRRYNDTSDMESRMYTFIWDLEEWLREHRDKPYILCEYAHAMGNSLGAIHKYTDLARRDPLYQGGFIWDYIDQTISAYDRYGRPYQAYGGDFDDRPHDYNFGANGLVCGDGTLRPPMQEVKYVYQDILIEVAKDKVKIENRSLFTPTGIYECAALLSLDGRKVAEAPMEADVPPLSAAEFPLPVSVGVPEGKQGEYTITVSFRLKKDTLWAKSGHEVAFGQGVFKAETPAAPICMVTPPAARLTRGIHNFGVHGMNFQALFSRQYGGLVSYRYGSKELIKSVPVPNFWRAPTDNDYGNRMPGRYGQWLLASRYASTIGHEMTKEDMESAMSNPVVEETDGAVRLAYTYRLPTNPPADCTLTYTVTGDGKVALELSWQPVAGLSSMPEFGVMLSVPVELDRIEWYGNGPEDTYSDRKHGAKLGIWKQSVADAVTPYSMPQECGNKTGVRWARLTDALGRGLLFTASEMEFSALPYSPFEMENARHFTELPLPYRTVVRASLMRMGVAGDQAWGARTHPEYLLPTDRPLSFTFSFVGI